jgi:hypothetical protein
MDTRTQKIEEKNKLKPFLKGKRLGFLVKFQAKIKHCYFARVRYFYDKCYGLPLERISTIVD